MSRDKAFNSEDILRADIGLEAYIDKGARTTVESHQGELAREGAPSDRAFVPRLARMAPEDFREAGFTTGCRGCAWLQDRVGSRVAHSTECRDRMEAAMMQSSTGKEKMQRAQDRQDHWVSEKVKKSDESHAQKDQDMPEVIDMEDALAADTSRRAPRTPDHSLGGDISDIEIEISVDGEQAMSGSPARGTRVSDSDNGGTEFGGTDVAIGGDTGL